ncbi:hypothetical protein KFE25_010949 [Diacronema lutheri]|uniref:ATP-dependent Clp protease proteolytic subunit n=2 Tax=Diacronema lutheri TaxID=2081491 RepID=A0A8J5XAZ5_DIALT|nr:hypothetical protein KFE25_010949 [Diacronema lutheri]
MGLAGAASERIYEGGRMGPPPDMPSLLLNNRIVYLGMPINSAVSQLIVAELLYLQYESNTKPCFLYINSPGLMTEGRQLVGLDTEGFAIIDTMGYVRAPITTICVGKAHGMAALILASGDKGKRGVMPYASVMLQQTLGQAQGQASDIRLSALEMLLTHKQMVKLLAERTGNPVERIAKDASRQFYLNAQEAVEYGVADKIMQKDAQKAGALSDLPVDVAALARGIV